MTKSILYISLIALLLTACQGADDSERSKAFIQFFGSSHSDEAACILETDDNGFMIGGSVWNETNQLDMALIKTDKEGFALWQYTTGNAKNDHGKAICRSGDNQFILAGHKMNEDSDDTDISISKVNTSGNKVWEHEYGGNYNQETHAITLAPDGGIIIVGCTDAPNTLHNNQAGTKDLIIMKISAEGDSLWTKTYGGAGSDEANSIVESHDGGYTIFGSSTSFAESGQAGTNMLVMQVNENGGILDRITFGGTNTDLGIKVIKTDDGFLFTGTTSSYGIGTSNIYVISTSINLRNVNWEKTYGGTATESATSIVKNQNGNITISGVTNSIGAGNNDMYILNLSETGLLILEKTYGSSGIEKAYDVVQTNDGGFAILGIAGYNENNMISLIKVDNNYEQ